MRGKASGEEKVWSRWCVESSSMCNKANQEDQQARRVLWKPAKCPTFSAPEFGKNFSLHWEFLVPKGQPLGAACHNALSGFLRNYSCKGKGESKCVWVRPYKKVIRRWWSVLWLMNCCILTTGTRWVFGSHTICIHYYYFFAWVIYSPRIWEYKWVF